MSTSALLASTMSGGSGSLDNSRAYHHLSSREWANSLSLEMEMAWKNQHNDTHSSNYYLNDNTERINNLTLHDNLYDYSKSIHSIEPSLDEQFNQLNGNSVSVAKKSPNMTETVPVPSSEHVAEIVGRQGCKIKSLRTQTNTYIKTPVRGAEPVFVVTGRKEDVAKAKQQILSAAEHFSSIRAKRNGSAGSQGNNQTVNSGTCSPPSTPGSVTVPVWVPYKVVGLVVGPKGATIKRIQQTTSTYIVTPGRDKDPVFEVTGTREQVDRAREEIEKHIASRTSNNNNSDLQIDDFQINGLDSNYTEQNTPNTTSNAPSNYNNVTCHDSLSAPSTGNNTSHSLYLQRITPSSTSAATQNHINLQTMSLSGSVGNQSQHISSSSNTSMPISDYNSILPNYGNLHHTTFKSNGSDFDADEGLGASGNSVYDPSALWSDVVYEVQRSNSVSVSKPKNELLPAGEDGPHPRTRRTNSDPLSTFFQNIDANTFASPANENCQSPISERRSRLQAISQNHTQSRSCIECKRAVADAAFVPCGHNSFCANCASVICKREPERRLCPVCFQLVERPIIIRN